MEYLYLAHSAIPAKGDAANYLTGTENFSVLTSQGVASCVASLLIGLPTSTCGLYGGANYGIVSNPFHSTNSELALLEASPTFSGHSSAGIDSTLTMGSAFSSAPGMQIHSNDSLRIGPRAGSDAEVAWNHLGLDLTRLTSSSLLPARAALQSAQEGVESTTPAPSETPEETTERLKHPFALAPQRVSITAPKESVPLGSPVDIDVAFAPGKLAHLDVTQIKQAGSARIAISEGGGSYKIVREAGRTSTIEIVPAQLGTVTLDVGAVYSDNSIAHQSITLNVAPSSKGLIRFMLDGGSPADVIVMGDEDKDRQKGLRPVVTYKDLPYPIVLDDLRTIKFSVEQDENDPVLRVDQGGTVHALREGTAYVVGDFEGVTDRVEFTVYSKDDAPAGFVVIPH